MEEYRQRGLHAARAQGKASQGDDLERWIKDQLTSEDVTNPLEWWSVNGSTYYPELAQMAVDLLSISAMSDEPEHLFSRLGLIITPRHNHIKQEQFRLLFAFIHGMKAVSSACADHHIVYRQLFTVSTPHQCDRLSKFQAPCYLTFYLQSMKH
jgi:hypothetical protein